MSKYYKKEDVISFLNTHCPKDMWEYQIADLPTIEVSEGVIGQGSGDIDWQAATSTGQEIYAYEDGRKSVEVSEDCISRKINAPRVVPMFEDCISREYLFGKVYDMDNDNLVVDLKDIEDAPSVVPSRAEGEWEEKETFHNADDNPIIEEWQSAKCSVCNKYHTTPYMYSFSNYNYCPNCGAKMKGADDE